MLLYSYESVLALPHYLLTRMRDLRHSYDCQDMFEIHCSTMGNGAIGPTRLQCPVGTRHRQIYDLTAVSFVWQKDKTLLSMTQGTQWPKANGIKFLVIKTVLKKSMNKQMW